MTASTGRRRILVGVGGGIAAYKVCSVIRHFTEAGDDVHVVPTRSALNFVGAATFEALSGNPVRTEVFEDVDQVAHVKLGQEADLVVIAPATADLMARAAAGRADDLLKVGGIFVSPLEVENVLTGHPAVVECAVVGEENQHGLVRALAYVVIRSGHSADDSLADALIQHCKQKLAHYKAPSRVEFVSDLPRSDRGKILRRVLRRGN